MDDKSKLGNGRVIFQVGPIGSRDAYLVIYKTDKGLRVRAGCWFGTDVDFLARVKDVHRNTEHENDYLAAIEIARKIFMGVKRTTKGLQKDYK